MGRIYNVIGRWNTIRHRIFFSILLFLVIPFILTFFLVDKPLERVIEQKIGDSARETLYQVNFNVGLFLDDMLKQAVDISTNPSITELLPDFLVLNGPDEQYLAGRSLEADGGISGTYGIMPELFMKIEDCFVRGQIEEARVWQFRVNEIISGLLATPSLYGACKAILRLRGIDCGQPRMPLLPIQEQDMALVAQLNEKTLRYIELSKA